MNKCFYYIKLPNGGEAKVSANFTLLSQEDYALSNLLDKYFDAKLEGDIDKTNNLRSQIVKYTETGLDVATIYAFLRNSESGDEFIEAVNERINERLNIKTVNDALFKLLRSKDKIVKVKDGKESFLTLSDFLTEISKVPSKKYFRQLNVNTVINMESVGSKLKELDDKIREHKENALEYKGLQALRDILKLAFPQGLEGDIRNTKMLFNASFNDNESLNTSIVIKNNGYLPTIFYNDSNDLSLFLGVFGYYASKLSEEDVIPIIEDYNKNYKERNQINLEDLDMDKLFVGYINEKDNFVDPEFLKILKNKGKTRKTMEALSALVVEELMKNSDVSSDEARNSLRNSLKRSMHELFLAISPKQYGHELFSLTNAAIAEFTQESIENAEDFRRTQKMAVRDFIGRDAVDYHYSAPELKTFKTPEDLQAFYPSIRLYKDIITVKSEGIWHSIVPMEIVKDSKGIVIKSGFYSIKGVLTEIKTPISIKSNETFYHRKLENEEQVEEDNSKEDAIPLEQMTQVVQIYGPVINEKTGEFDYVPNNIVKVLAVKGSRAVYKYFDNKSKTEKEGRNVINKIYPNKVVGNKITEKGYMPNIDLDRITMFTAPLSAVEGLDKFTSLTTEEREKFLAEKVQIKKTNDGDYLPIMSGDFIRTKKGMHNEVIAVDKNDIYILIKTQDKNKTKTMYNVKAIKRSDIEMVYTNRIDDQVIATMLEIAKEFSEIYLNDHSIRDAKYSYFLSINEARDGDYAIVDGQIYKILSKENSYGIAPSFKSSQDRSYEYAKIDFSQATAFITRRDISNIDSKTIADINNFALVTADSPEDIRAYPQYAALGYKLVPATYVIPKKSKREPVLLKSGNFDMGSVRWGEGTVVSNDYKDVTKELVERINKDTRKRATTGKNLYIFQKGEVNGQVMRYNKSLQEYRLLDEAGNTDSNYEKFKKAIRTNCYIGFARKEGERYRFNNKLFKVMSTNRMQNSDDVEVVVEYSGISNNGDYVTIRKKFMLNDAFENKKIKALYVNKDSKVYDTLENEIEKKIPKKAVAEKEELIMNLAEQMKNLFNIETTIVNIAPTKENKLRNKKAWITQNEDGKPTIIVNKYSVNNDGTYKADQQDVVHEFMHLFLIALRYSGNNKLYDQIIEEYRKEKMGNQTLHAFEIEEDMVNYLSKEFLSNGYLEDSDKLKNSIFEGIIKSIMSISEDITPIDFKQLSITSLESLLSKNMGQIFKFRKGVNLEMKNSNMVYFDANFREFLDKSIKDGTIKIECN